MIEIKNLTKTFSVDSEKVEALKNINLTISDGDIYGIIGMSGAGKSTLVRCLNLLERPDKGEVIINGVDMTHLKPKELRNARRNISMIFQGFNLLMQRNCIDNICFPLELAGIKRADALKRAKVLLETVGLSDKEKAYPSQLSGGQKQRIAIARALATQPKVLLCDEATSALDPNTTHSILSLIKEINEKLKITVVMITHQMSVVEEICNKVAILENGQVVEEGEVNSIFLSPQTEAAQRLVFPSDTFEQIIQNKSEKIVRLVFNGAHITGTPIIAKLAIEKNVLVNILSASTRTIGGQCFGSMLLSVPAKDNQIEIVLEYLKNIPQVEAMEVNQGVENTAYSQTEVL